MIKNLLQINLLKSQATHLQAKAQIIKNLITPKQLINISPSFFSSQFDAKQLRQRLAQIEFKTLQKHDKNTQIQDLLFDIGYRLESETQYKEPERNLIMLLNIGDVNMKSNQLELAQEALKDLTQFLQNYTSDADLKSTLLPQAQKRLGMIMQKQGDVASALNHYLNAVNTIEERAKVASQPLPADDIRLLISLYEKLGNLEKSNQKVEKSLEYYKKAHEISKQLFKPIHPFNIKISFLIGDALRRLKQDKEALEYLQSSLENLDSKTQQNCQLLTLATNSAALVQLNLKEFENALVTIKSYEVKTQDSKFQTPQQLAQIYDLKGIVLRSMGKEKEAFETFYKALQIAQKVFPDDHEFVQNIKKALLSLKKSSGEKQ